LKKVIIISLLILLTASLKAQVIVIQTTSSAYASYNQEQQQWSSWSEWTDCSVIIRIDITSSLIKIDNKFNDSFKILEKIKEDKRTDSYDDGYTSTTFSTVDRDGKTPNIKLKIFDSKEFRSLFIIPISCTYTRERKLNFKKKWH